MTGLIAPACGREYAIVLLMVINMRLIRAVVIDQLMLHLTSVVETVRTDGDTLDSELNERQLQFLTISIHGGYRC